jgi:acetyl esterase/lipase
MHAISNNEEHAMTYRKLAVCLAALVALAVAGSASAQAPSVVRVTAPAQPGSIPLMPDAGPAPRPEIWVKFGGKDYAVRNVTRATITPFLPKAGTANGSAVIVAPGGAFMILAIEHEGWKVARALTDRGITVFVLKYRLDETPEDEAEFGKFAAERMGRATNLGPNTPVPRFGEGPAMEDALAAVRYVRANAKRWGVDPARVGMMGFSAGAMTTLNAGLAPAAADRPAFIAPIYPPMTAREVPADAPPILSRWALDDESLAARDSASSRPGMAQSGQSNSTRMKVAGMDSDSANRARHRRC